MSEAVAPDGAATLRQYLSLLMRRGWTRLNVDTMRGPNGQTVQHHYTGGEWTLTRRGSNNDHVRVVRYRPGSASPAELIEKTAWDTPVVEGGN